MEKAQRCQPQEDRARPGSVAGSLDQNMILKTLNLHANAINTALRRQLALEKQVKELEARPLANPAVATAPSSPIGTANWLEAALNRKPPEDGKPFIYFFHIIKTSGTSFHHFLTDTFGEANVSPLRTWEQVLAYCGGGGNWKVWSGHFGGLLPFVLPSWPRIVTILRDPVDRAISTINHAKRDPTHPFHVYVEHMSILEYCHHPRFRSSLDNVQARFLASLSFALMILRGVRREGYPPAGVGFGETLFSLDPQYNLLDLAIKAMMEMDMVGIAEAHHQTLRLFARKFNVPAPAEPYYENKAGESQLKRADLSSEELDCIQGLNQIDRVVYAHARERFERDCRQAKLAYELG